MHCYWLLLCLALRPGAGGGSTIPAGGAEDPLGSEEGGSGGWRCPQFEEHPAFECSCDLPHTLRCTGDRSAMQIIGRTLRSLPTHRAVSLLDCTVQNVSALNGPLLEGVALHGLVVSSGEIRDVHSAAFRGLAAPLQALGLPNNQLTTVPTAALAMLQGLDRLDLSYNKLKSIDQNSFEGSTNLTFLELSENQLTTLTPGCFKPLRLLSTLRLRGNKLEASALPALKDLLSLSELDLSSNRLTGPLGPNSLPGLKGLHLLQLGENAFTSIKRGALAGLINLTSLSLHHNQIDVIEDHAFRQLSNLTELDLAHNGIVAVSGNSLAHLVRLQKLDLAHNFLRALTADLIRPLIALRELRLDDNDISIVAGDALGPHVILDRLTLSDNPLNCDCSLSEFAAWLRANDHLSSLDRASAVCTTPPHLEGAALRSLSHRSLACGGERDGDVDEDEEDDDEDEDDSVESVLVREESEAVTTVYKVVETRTEALVSGDDDDYYVNVSKEQVTLSEFHYDGTLVRLRWTVESSALPYTCDAVFVYEEQETKEAIMSSEPLHCDSTGMPEPQDLRVTVPGSRDLKIGHKYRYCVALLQGSRDSDDLNLVLGCSDVLPLRPTISTGEIVRKEPTVRVSGVRSNVTSGGTLSIQISLFGYPPNRPQNLQLQNGVDPSPDQIAEYFDALNNCYVSLAVLAQGSLIAQSDTQCENTFVKMEGFMEGPYKVCASLSEFQVTGPNTKCVLAEKISKTDVVQSSVMGLNMALVAACVGLVTAVVVLIWASRKLLKKPKQIVQTHQSFVADPQACDDVQHSRYVKLHATTKL